MMSGKKLTYLTEWAPGEARLGRGMFAEPRGQYSFTMTEVSRVPDAREFINLMKICCKCHKVPAKTLYSCNLGHVTCSECVSKDMLCERKEVGATLTCFRSVSVTACHAFSTVLDETIVVCPRCGMLVEGRHISNHEYNCLENLPCGFTMCFQQKRYTKKLLIEHLTDEHGVTLYQPRTGRVTHALVESMYSREVGSWKISFMMEYEDTIFVCAYGREVVDKIVSLVVIIYYIAMDNKGPSYKSYHGTVMLRSGESYTGSFCNIKNVNEHIIQSGRCLIVPVEIKPHGHNSHGIHLRVYKGISEEEGYSLENLFTE